MNTINILTHLLVSIKTGYIANNTYTYTKYNSFCLEILLLLYKDGLISGYQVEPASNKIKIKLKYIRTKPLLTNITLLSKPSFKVYQSYKDMVLLFDKYDYFFLSTSVGVLSSRQFLNKYKVGGQLLFACKIAVI